MKNYKQFIAGVVVGGVLLSGGSALANSVNLPSITNWVKYKFNGEEKALPSGYTTLNYEGRTYVPTRFIAEELGAEVEWDDVTKTVSINTLIENDDTELNEEDLQKETEEESEKEIDNDTDSEKDDSIVENLDKYDELPVSKTIGGVRVEVYDIEEKPEYTKLYLSVKNTTEERVQLDQGTAYFHSEFDTYANKDMSRVLFWKDITWFSDMQEDDEVEGYIMLPPIPEDEKYGKFYVEVYENSLDHNIMNYEFDIKW